MKIFKTICNVCLIIFVIIALIIDGFYIYLKFFDNKTTTGIYNIDDQIPVDLVEQSDNLTDQQIKELEARKLFNVQYYSNSVDNGIEVQELNINYFTDWTLTTNAVRGTGMQYLGNYVPYTSTANDVDSFVKLDFWYYDTTNFISWSGGKVATQLNRDQKLIIKIDDKPYRIQLTKSWTVEDGWWIFKTTKYYYSDWGDVFADVLKAVKTNSQGYGEWYITLDLSDYFTIESFNEETKKFEKDTTTDILKNYATIKFNYYENGLANSSQSLFGLIEGDKTYGYQSSDVDTTYWQDRIVYNLDCSYFNQRESSVHNGKFLSLSYDFREIFKDMPRNKVNIVIDLDNYTDIIGIDYNGFEDFKIDTLIIKSSDNKNFYLLNECLVNTKLQFLKRDSTINLVFDDNVINSEYSEVVL